MSLEEVLEEQGCLLSGLCLLVSQAKEQLEVCSTTGDEKVRYSCSDDGVAFRCQRRASKLRVATSIWQNRKFSLFSFLCIAAQHYIIHMHMFLFISVKHYNIINNFAKIFYASEASLLL